jgi:hypothetical protein
MSKGSVTPGARLEHGRHGVAHGPALAVLEHDRHHGCLHVRLYLGQQAVGDDGARLALEREFHLLEAVSRTRHVSLSDEAPTPRHDEADDLV